MKQYSSTCPYCSFVLLFYDASLFGRRGRCPKCRNKFVLEKPDSGQPDTVEIAPKDAPAAKEDQPPQNGSAAAAAPPQKQPTGSVTTRTSAIRKQAAAAASEAPATETLTAWETDLSRGLVAKRPMLSPRWTLPNVFAPLTIGVIAAGGMIGAGLAMLVTNASTSVTALASAAGGAIAAGFLVRRYDPREPKS